MNEIKLTSYSHGSGCGCKISPALLQQILLSGDKRSTDPKLLVGNETNDDAAVYQIDEQQVILSTTDFFTPIVNDPFDFGAIASVNAISDIYAMGGTPFLALSILGWPVDKLSTDAARLVVEGARQTCNKVGISLAGGHSIDTPEPIFGLAVTGLANRNNIKTNNTAIPGCELFLTKPLGIGILTTALKKNLIHPDHLKIVTDLMLELNSVGKELGKLKGVKAMTDVTGFGLLGHLIEICEGSGVSAEIEFEKIPQLPMAREYINLNTIPGGTRRNYESYCSKVNAINEDQRNIICDPQTSGGLLVAVDSSEKQLFLETAASFNLFPEPFGRIIDKSEKTVVVR